MSPEWEAAYVANRINPAGIGQLYHLLDTFCHGHQARVLEMGCGLGGNVEYWFRRHADYYGIEGSQAAVDGLLRRFPYLKHNVVRGDFSTDMPFQDEFDVVFDRASIAHNSVHYIRSTLDRVWASLKPGGIFVGCDWFSSSHSEYERGDYGGLKSEGGEIDTTRTNYKDGQFAGVGTVHFTDRNEIDELFDAFQGVFLEERIAVRPAPNGRFITDVNPFRWVSRHYDKLDYVSAVFDIVARKPA